MTGCWFAENLIGVGPCDGRLVKCHLLPRSRMKTKFPEGALWLVGQTEAISRRTWRREHMAATCTIPVLTEAALYRLEADPRSWVWGCGGPLGNAGHHGQLDTARTLRIPRELLPPEVEEFASELGLMPWLDREYGELQGSAA